MGAREAISLSQHTLLAALAVACLAASIPLAGAEPLFEKSYDPPPERQNRDRDGYYFRIVVSEPEAPREAAEGDDCASWRPQGVGDSALPLVKPFLGSQPDPTAFHGISPWFPSCVAVTAAPGSTSHACRVTGTACATAGPAPAAYVAWNVADGRVYVEPAESLGRPLVAHLPVAMSADCEDCPPGNLLA